MNLEKIVTGNLSIRQMNSHWVYGKTFTETYVI